MSREHAIVEEAIRAEGLGKTYAEGRLRTPEEFGGIVLRAGHDGRTTLLRVGARLEMAAPE